MSDIVRRAEATANKEVQPSERPPPRIPYDEPAAPAKGTGRTDLGSRTDVSSNRTDVRVVTDSRDRAHVNVDTHEGGATGKWPRDAEEWKRLLAKAAPWLAAAALVAAGVRAYKQNDGESVGNKARRTADRAGRAVKDAADDAEHGWFGLKRRTNEAVDSAGDKAHDAKHAAGKKAEEAKGAASRAAEAAKDSARNAAARTSDKFREAKHEAGHLAGDAVGAVKHGAHEVAEGARRAEHAAEGLLGKGAAKAGVAEEKTGRAMQDAGKRVEKAGHDTRMKYGDVPVEAPRKKFLGIF